VCDYLDGNWPQGTAALISPDLVVHLAIVCGRHKLYESAFSIEKRPRTRPLPENNCIVLFFDSENDGAACTEFWHPEATYGLVKI